MSGRLRGGAGGAGTAVLAGIAAAVALRAFGQLATVPCVLGGVVAALGWAATTWTLRAGSVNRRWPDEPDPQRLAGWPRVSLIANRLEREAAERRGGRGLHLPRPGILRHPDRLRLPARLTRHDQEET